jgi:nickel-dependent lactate racemase
MNMELPFLPAPVRIEIPDAAFCQLLEPVHVAPHPDPLFAIADALDNPVGGAKLEDMVSPSSRVAILCDDISRPTPTHLLAPLIIERLLSAGVSGGNIKIIMALGTHRPMTRYDMEHKLGKKIVSDYRVENSLFHGRENLKHFGKSDDGAEILITKAALDADIRIGMGTIMPHPAMGWSGGGKIIYPGIAGEETVLHFHHIHAMAEENFFGMDNAPIRLLVEKWVGMVGLHFVVNTVLNADLALYRVVAGHYVQAHRRGVAYAKEVFEAKLAEEPNIVIADPHPTYYDFGQSCKGYVSADKVFGEKSGGTIILVSPMPEGAGPHPETIRYIGMDDAKTHLEKRIDEGVLGDDPVGLALNTRAAEIRKHRRLLMVTDGVPAELCALAGISHYPLRDLPKAIADAMADYDSPRISVMPHAAETVIGREGK